MAPSEAQSARRFISEDLTTVNRYNILKEVGIKLFTHMDWNQEALPDSALTIADQFLAEGAQKISPPVRASFWEHTFLAEELAGRLAHKLGEDETMARFLLKLHDVGVLIGPDEFFRRDLLSDRLFAGCGIPRKLLHNMPPLYGLLSLIASLQLSHEQNTGEQPLDSRQEGQLEKFFASMTPLQLIVNFADNLGKKTDGGEVFTIETFTDYLRTQEQRYGQTSPWPSMQWAIPHRQSGTPLVPLYIIEKTAAWLKGQGVELRETITGLENYCPRFVILARHGEVANPKNIVYARDREMNMNDWIHLSDTGTVQADALARLIRERAFRVTSVLSSPSSRAVETATHIANSVKLSPNTEDGLDDIYAPGAYKERYTMDQLAALEKNELELSRLEKQYGHETHFQLVDRMQKFFLQVVKTLHAGQTGVLVSHGHPLGYLAHHLLTGEIPKEHAIRTSPFYPPKGGAILCILDPQGKFFTAYPLVDPSLSPGAIY